MALSSEEIRLRLQELRNLQRLHGAQKIRIALQDERITLLEERNTLLEEQNSVLTTTVQTLTLQVEELRTIVFGKKKERRNDDDTKGPPHVRSADSYHRPLPKEEEVTDTKHHPVDTCTECAHPFTRTRTKEYFEEDIPLQKKTVVKHTVIQGYCDTCKVWRSGASLPSAKVILGPNVKRYVTYLSVVSRQSYAQIQDLLRDTYQFDLSSGEIYKILSQEGEAFRPEYEQLAVSIRGEPSVHLDETSWPLQQRDGYQRYAWTMVGGETTDAVYLLGKSRGGGNADILLGESEAVRVTDDFSAYWNRSPKHQLCCAHILRKLRDLATSRELAGETKEHCATAYTTFAQIYADIETARVSVAPQASYEGLFKRLITFSMLSPSDPKKLAAVRTQVRERTERYLTCLLHPGVASDNNAAERSLRHLVIKRKTSFGSFSEKTAETLAILTSVLLSYRRQGMLGGWLRGV